MFQMEISNKVNLGSLGVCHNFLKIPITLLKSLKLVDNDLQSLIVSILFTIK